MTTTEPQQARRIGSDIGGTFTDVAALDVDGRLRIGKRLTTHGAEADGVLQAIADTEVNLGGSNTIVAHGTTLVINSLLERKGAVVAFVATAGFGDVLELARASRPDIFDVFYRRDPVLVPASLRFELNERVSGTGEVEIAPSERELAELTEQIRACGATAIGVTLLNSYLNPDNEQRVREFLEAALPGVPVTISSDLSRKWREYERSTTTAANAYVVPVAETYIERLVGGLQADGFEGDFIVLDSSGGAVDVDTARKLPIRLVESGPVGGVIAAQELARREGIDALVTFDMGGTTAKSCLIENGQFEATELYWIGSYERGFPLQIRCMDVAEIGAGGGSIAWVDEAGSLRVGPRSAGSAPGPACYGRGGTQPTVTDANLLTGRLPKDHFSASLTLDEDAARKAMSSLAALTGLDNRRLALGILKLANLSMAAVVRRQTLERGRDPRNFTLIASGGAGPMHACEVAAEVGIGKVLIPLYPGHFSAIGMLAANLRRDRREVFVAPLDEGVGQTLGMELARVQTDLTEELLGGAAVGSDEVSTTFSLFLRQRDQDHVLSVPAPTEGVTLWGGFAGWFVTAFVTEYERRYGHRISSTDIELVEFEVVVERKLPQPRIAVPEFAEVPEYTIESAFASSETAVTSRVISRTSLRAGDRVDGPAIIVEEGATTVVPPGAFAACMDDSSILIDVSAVVV